MDGTLLLGGGKPSAKGERGITKRLDALAEHAPVCGDRLLDVGCGDGSYTLRMMSGFREVEAIDIEPERLDSFRAHLDDPSHVTVRQMGADQLHYPDHTFDMVTAIEVMEHVQELDAALAEIRRVLTPSGWFLMTSPNRWFPFETHGVLHRGRRYRPGPPFITWIPPLHRRHADARVFTAHGLARRARRQGLTCVGTGYIMPPFDASPAGKRIRSFTDRLERSPARVFGMALALAFRPTAR